MLVGGWCSDQPVKSTNENCLVIQYNTPINAKALVFGNCQLRERTDANCAICIVVRYPTSLSDTLLPEYSISPPAPRSFQHATQHTTPPQCCWHAAGSPDPNLKSNHVGRSRRAPACNFHFTASSRFSLSLSSLCLPLSLSPSSPSVSLCPPPPPSLPLSRLSGLSGLSLSLSVSLSPALPRSPSLLSLSPSRCSHSLEQFGWITGYCYSHHGLSPCFPSRNRH